ARRGRRRWPAGWWTAAAPNRRGERGQEPGMVLAQPGPQLLHELGAPPDRVLVSAGEHGDRAARPLSAGRVRCRCASLRKILASVIASAWSLFFPDTDVR